MFLAPGRDPGQVNPGETRMVDLSVPTAPLGETPSLVLAEWVVMALVIVIGMIVERRRRPPRD